MVPLGAQDRDGSGALARIRDVALLTHVVRGIVSADRSDHIVVAGPTSDHREYADALAAVGGSRVDLVPGAGDRIESTRLALLAAEPTAKDVVLVHDATRPFTPVESITAVVDAIRAGAPAAVPVEPVTDTVKVVDSSGVVRRTSDRDHLRRAQSPRGFVADVLDRTDLVKALDFVGVSVRAVAGHPNGMRVDTTFDRTVAEALLEGRE
ncbi:2-C-methyl-D-erythritol 4-phosphate cytidylyltransferase [Saccharomonospora sp. NB11]|uniref:IspD/TarI family cytidylyltransferase n=1 Tax=Saccharomonospora sp. NB11 TaxID=1642298 RepID=UPI0035A8EA6E